MDQKASKDLAPRELLGNVYTAQNEMETWHLPKECRLCWLLQKGGHSQHLGTWKAEIIYKAPDFSFTWIYISTCHTTPTKTPCLWRDWTMTKHLGRTTFQAGPCGTHRRISQISEAKACLKSEWRSNLPKLLLFFFFSHQINSACEVLLFLKLSQDELAFAGGVVIWEHTILHKGSFYVKQKCFILPLSWGERKELTCFSSKGKRANPETTKMLALFIISKLK